MCTGLAAVLAEFPDVCAAYLFGSTARGDDRPDSDVDVGVVMPRGVAVKDCHRLLADVSTRLEAVTTPRDVDVVLLEERKPILAHNALRDGRLLVCHDEERRVDFESSTCVRAFDWRPSYDLMSRGAIDGVKRWLEGRRR